MYKSQEIFREKGIWIFEPGVEFQSDPPWNLGTSPDTRGEGLFIFRASLNTWALR